MARKRTPGALPGSTARAARPCGTACRLSSASRPYWLWRGRCAVAAMVCSAHHLASGCGRQAHWHCRPWPRGGERAGRRAMRDKRINGRRAGAQGKSARRRMGQSCQCLAVGLYGHGLHVCPTGLTRQSAALTLTVSLRVWQALGPELRLIIETAAADASRHQSAGDQTTAGTLLRAQVVENNVNTYRLPADVMSAIDRVSEAVVADIASKDHLARAINASYLAAFGQLRHNSPFTSCLS